jgi:hypothetical protein
MRRVALALLVGIVPAVATGQLPQIHGYYLNVAFAADGTPLSDAALSATGCPCRARSPIRTICSGATGSIG